MSLGRYYLHKFSDINNDNDYVSSYQLKWAVNDKLRNTAPEMIGGLGPAIRRAMEHHEIRDKFSGVCPELEQMGVTRVEVTDQGLKFVSEGGE